MDNNTFNFFCSKCNYGTNYKQTYERHILSGLHLTGTKTIIPKTIIIYKFYCDTCDFGVFSKKLIDVHTKTKKHNSLINSTFNNPFN